MPFTPFHFGPGVLIKSFVSKKFSLIVFIATQVLIDLETLYFIVTRQHPLHRLFHTYLGCNLAIVILLTIFWPLYNYIGPKFLKLSKISFKTALISASIGAYSHVFFDSLMHRDLRPFYPFSDRNPMLNIINIELLYLICIVSGVVGAGVWLCNIWGQHT